MANGVNTEYEYFFDQTIDFELKQVTPAMFPTGISTHASS